MKRLAVCTITFLFLCATAVAQDLPSITKKTKDFEKQDGYFTYYWDDAEGKIWLEIDELEKEFLYVNSLTSGVGSNDIGLDRNQLGDSRVVYFDRRGPKVLMVQPNYAYRATGDNKKEQASVRDAFAKSILWGFKVGAATGDRILIDVTDFLMQDAHGVSNRLQSGGQGSYSL